MHWFTHNYVLISFWMDFFYFVYIFFLWSQQILNSSSTSFLQLCIIVLLVKPPKVQLISGENFINSPSGDRSVARAWLEKRAYHLMDEMLMVETRLEQMHSEYVLLKTHLQCLKQFKTESWLEMELFMASICIMSGKFFRCIGAIVQMWNQLVDTVYSHRNSIHWKASCNSFTCIFFFSSSKRHCVFVRSYLKMSTLFWWKKVSQSHLKKKKKKKRRRRRKKEKKVSQQLA